MECLRHVLEEGLATPDCGVPHFDRIKDQTSLTSERTYASHFGGHVHQSWSGQGSRLRIIVSVYPSDIQ
jgi:hypothetical protein